jgi:hypothetical protein
MGSERVNREIREFLEAERKQEKAAADKLASEANLERIKKELAVNAGKLIQSNKKTTFGHKEHPPVSERVMNAHFESEDEKEKFNRAEAQAWLDANQHVWKDYNSEENIELILSVYSSRYLGQGESVIGREEIDWAFKTLLADGLLEPVVKFTAPPVVNVPTPEAIEPELERLPLDFRMPVSYQRDTTGQEGIDPNTGERKHYTDLEIGRMSAETYRRTFMPIRDLNAFAGRR